MDNTKTHEHTVKFKYIKTTEGYVAQCSEVPSIIVQAKTLTALKKNLKIANEGYFKAFPIEHKIIFGTDKEKFDQLKIEI